MKHVKVIFVTIVLNIFLMLLVSIMLEYSNLSERFNQISNTVQMALDSSLQLATESEELFSSEFKQRILSNALVDNAATGRTVTTAASTLVYNGGWYSANPYILAMAFEATGGLPQRYVYQSYESTYDSTAAVYQYLYGQVGSQYSAGSLSWANKNQQVKDDFTANGVGMSRNPLAEFNTFYSQIGYKVKTLGYVKKHNLADDSYEMVLARYSVLNNMGLNFSSGDTKYNQVSSLYMTDNFCSSVHIGKYRNGMTSDYYLTPNSLGVTYVPVKVLKANFVNTLNTLVRLNRASASGVDGADAWNADGCIPSLVWDGGTTQVAHSGVTGKIVNDGSAEYDLSSAQVKVDYFLVNFYNPAYRDVVVKIEGSAPSDVAYNKGMSRSGRGLNYGTVGNTLNSTVASLQQSDLETNRYYRQWKSGGLSAENASVYEEDFGNRIVAKVTARVKIHVPYESSILQWAAHMFRNSGSENHLGVRLWNPSANIAYDEDGVYFIYTTYYAATR